MTIQSAPAMPGEHLHRFRTAVRGDVHLPGDPGWDVARQAWQVLVDQQPAAVVAPHDDADVAAAVQVAAELGLRVAPQSTGHGAGAIGTLTDTVLLRTCHLDLVHIDPEGRTAVVGAGATWDKVGAAAAEHGLVAVAGMAGGVGVVGYTLGGGLGWLARSHGLAINSVRRITAVDAHGRIVHADADTEPDLFWALRGGTAPVVVTELELHLHPLERLWAGSMLWPIERAPEVVRAWQQWITHVPESVTSLVRVLRYPSLPQIPEFLRGRSLVGIEAAIQHDDAASAELLAPLRALHPEIDSMRPMSPSELGTVHGDPNEPTPAYTSAVALDDISGPAMDAWLDAILDPASAALLSVELRHLGAAVARPLPNGGAVSAIPATGLAMAVGIVPFPEAFEPVRAAADRVVAALRPYASARAVKNFADGAVPPELLYDPQTLARLRDVVTAWDPESLFRTAHHLG